MNQIYFEAKGEALLERIGMSKSEFARRMGIHKQNVKVLFKSKNLETIYKASRICCGCRIDARESAPLK